MTKLHGERAAAGFTLLIIWTCLAGLFAMTLGYSRILYAAAKNGDFFAPFAQLHPTKGYPWAALALLCVLTALFCFVPLQVVIDGAVTVRIVVQFIGQIFALHVVRRAGTAPVALPDVALSAAEPDRPRSAGSSCWRRAPGRCWRCSAGSTPAASPCSSCGSAGGRRTPRHDDLPTEMSMPRAQINADKKRLPQINPSASLRVHRRFLSF